MSLSGKLRDAVNLAVREFGRGDGDRGVNVVHFDKPETPATVLFVDCRHKLGSDWVRWEPETIWLSLPETALVNREKILAAAALATHPQFYWDWRVMGHTAQVFSAMPGLTTDAPNPTPEQLAWAVFEAELIFALADEEEVTPDFDDEVAAYAAAILHDEGWVLAPDILGFCQDQLEQLLNPEARDLAAKVKAAWTAHPKADLEQKSFEDSALGVQLARQAELLVYLEQRADALRKALSG